MQTTMVSPQTTHVTLCHCFNNFCCVPQMRHQMLPFVDYRQLANHVWGPRRSRLQGCLMLGPHPPEQDSWNIESGIL